MTRDDELLGGHVNVYDGIPRKPQRLHAQLDLEERYRANLHLGHASLGYHEMRKGRLGEPKGKCIDTGAIRLRLRISENVARNICNG